VLKILIKTLLALVCIFAIANDDQIKAKEHSVLFNEAEEMVGEFALKNGSSGIVKKDTHKPPLEWPVDVKLIKQVIMVAPNIAKIDMKVVSNVFCAHTGLVLFANPNTKTLIIKHIVEGGVCYISALKNVDELRANVGDIIKGGVIVGKSKSVMFEVRQLNVQIPPSIDMLLPPINPTLLKVVKKIK